MHGSPFRKVGEKYGNFVVTRYREIPEILSTLIELEHLPTGAQIMHLANEDDENLFNLSFRTHPEKSNGVAHILEHTVLCGSHKFPVKDPFFSMTRRSLNTFMNALTGPDFTCYPASSLVIKDFYNLLEVYLDAVFHPLLSKLSFLQEGHRLEFLKPDDPNSPLIFKGIVFNEMKGALASPDARLSEAIMEGLFPQITYGVNSGGDPKDIVTLSYEELKEFHDKFYHPSRCLFYFYGNLPTQGHLDFLEEHAFKEVGKKDSLPLLAKQPRFSDPVRKKLHYPIREAEEGSDKILIGMAWLTCSILEQEDLLALIVLDVVLTGTDAAPLKMALLKSNLLSQADSTIESEMSEVPFVIICKGCKENSADELEGIVRSVLKKIVEEGIPQNLIEAAIHQIEMARTEITGNSSPYGLSLFWRSALLKQHGGDPEDGLKVHTLFNKLREHVKDPHYFPQIIEKYFLQNPHFVRIEMEPDPQLAAQESELERLKLEALANNLKDKDVAGIIQQAKELAQFQEEQTEEEIEILPKVTLEDVSRKEKEFPLVHDTLGNLNIFYHPCFTNEITYVDLVFDLPEIEENDLSLLRLFTVLLPQVGCGGRDYRQYLEYLLEHTGGIGVSLDLCLQAESCQLMRPSLIFRAKALNRKLDKLFPLMRDMVISADFTDRERLKELLMQHVHGLENHIQQSSLRYAVNLASRGFSSSSRIVNAWYGLDYFWWLQKQVAQFEKEPQTLIEHLQRMQNQALSVGQIDLVLSTDEATVKKLKEAKFYGLGDIPSQKGNLWKGTYPLAEKLSQARIISSPVAFTAMLLPTIAYTHPLAAALSISSEIMEKNTLHKKIREQGGAYGSGAVNGLLAEQFYFYSYRDPHIKSTLKAFRDAIHELSLKKFSENDIEEAKLGLFQDLDAPTPPGSRAMTAYLRWRGGRDPETRQRFRDALILCDSKQIQQVAKEVLIPGLEQSVTVSFAGKELLEKENALLKEKALPIFPI